MNVLSSLTYYCSHTKANSNRRPPTYLAACDKPFEALRQPSSFLHKNSILIASLHTIQSLPRANPTN